MCFRPVIAILRYCGYKGKEITGFLQNVSMAISDISPPPPFFNLHSILQSSYLALEIDDHSTSCSMAFKNHFNCTFILVEKIKL